MKGIWFSELQHPGLAISCEAKDILHHEQSEYQDIKVIDTDIFGRMLLLDDVIQTTQKDEYIYHEMITHVALNTHPNPEKVLVIGGGDGGSIREIIKHDRVKKAILCEIDKSVVEVSKKYLPDISCGLDHPKTEVMIDDGIKLVNEASEEYDIIIIDSTDPVGPAEGLFSGEFYKAVHNALKEDGIFVAQTESPFFNRKLIRRILGDVKEYFQVARLFLGNIPTYPGGLWTFTMGSKKYRPEDVDINSIPELNTRYYSREIHKTCLILPPFVKELLE